MALNRTIDLLPEIFRTNTNRKFLSATLDQLTQEPNIRRTQGYVGRRVGPGVNPADKYITEPTQIRDDYQLEPGVVFLKTDTAKAVDAITYPGIIDSLALQDGDVSRQDRLWESEYYTWDPFVDFDKFSNYSQYYWIPAGPDSVDVGNTDIPLTDDIAVTRTTTAYQFFGTPGNNPIITLARGGNYTFDVNQTGHNFWIQSTPGINGRLPQTPNISSRDVYGVVNNGEDDGSVEFYVPLKNAQDFYYNLTELAPVDLVTGLEFNQINNIYVSVFLEQFPSGIDGITQLNGRSVIFTNRIFNSEEGGWQVNTQFDPVPSTGTPGAIGTFDTTAFDQTSDITLQNQRYSVWRINYVYDTDGNPYMTLESVLDVPNLSKFRIRYGATYNNTYWYKNASGYYQQQPLLTAVQDVLYYQDSTNPEIFGEIRLIDPAQSDPIIIDEIVGAKNYTSPNGVVFTNGLKVQFRGPTYPAKYQDQEYYIEGVGTGPGVKTRVGFINGQAYFGPFHEVEGQKITGATHTGYFQQYIYDTVETSLINYGAGGPTGAPISTTSVTGADEGNGIKLIPVSDLITPETYTKSELIPYSSLEYDVGGYDASINAPLIQDYITISRASTDRNAWSRSNRWFHIDVINYSAERNNIIPVIDNAQRAKRPIIEFRANLKLWNYGTLSKRPINIIDFNQTDALSNVNGQIGYGIDGYTFLNGTLVIFAADIDPNVRNRIYEVQFIDPNDSGTLRIDLVPVENGEVLYDETVVSLNGATLQGKSFWFDGDQWISAQQKTGVNQAPLFDVYDLNGRSFGDRAVYPSTTFVGNKLFGYAITDSSTLDPVLGLALKYLTINNVGDIVFSNYLYDDTFIYVKDKTSTTVNVSDGFIRQYIDRVTFSNQIGWQPAAAENRSRQVFRFTYANQPLVLDVPVDVASIYPPVQIFIEGVFVDPGNYTTVVNSNGTTTITFSITIANDTVIELQAISNIASSVAFYQVPMNLENNALNNNSSQFTLGTIRTHYNTIGQNLKTIVGPINGANNSRDLGNIIPYGQNIVQHSSPLVLPGVFLRKQQYELFNSLTYNSQEYTKYKALLLDVASRNDFVNLTPTQILDASIEEITLGRNQLFPFYWSDMLPSNQTYTELTYTVSPISTAVFDTTQVYDFDTSNFFGLLVYQNGTILVKDYDYTVSTDSSTITILTTLMVGDVIAIREYSTTYGSYVPNTPTKMGLYPAYKPQIFIDESYVTPTEVIQGHDGSITVAFGDFRDQVLLEFETRIFNNLKIQTSVPLLAEEVIPGQFRTTDYTLDEVNSILKPDFLGWVGWNKLDYTAQNYQANNPFTYNYNQSGNKLNGSPLLGGWRGIYQYFYDTTTPNTTPWEMLGFSEEPEWWQDTYGPAPYTSGNLVLWQDLEAGYIADPANPRIDPLYIRTGLTNVIPSGSEGVLLAPLSSVVGNYDATSFRRSWAFGDDGPVENAWKTSSSWPFAVMRLLALTKPAKFFSLFVDRDRYIFDTGLDQYLWDNRYRLEAKNVTPLYGNGNSTASYINWIIDYNQQRGIDSSTGLTETLANLDIRLCWRLAAFSDKKFLKIYTERSTPSGSNTGLLLPDESYQLLLYQDPPFEKITYSSVIVQTTSDGWAVYGYASLASFFEILVSKPNGKKKIIAAGGSDITVPSEYTNNIVRVPYGFVFTNRAAVCDFLLSYGKLLEQNGMTFEGIENGLIMNWDQMAQEFLYWSNQGWTAGSIINLNPGATSIAVTRPGAVAESLYPPRLDNLILNQNKQIVQPSNLVFDRLDNTFKVSVTSSDTICYLNLRFTAYEHLIVLDNTSIFADLIYNPVTGARQSRVLVSGWLSGDWNGTVNAPGFILNQDNIQEWQPNQKYTKGDIVLFKDQYWSASTIIKPSAMFDYNLWLKSDYAQIQKGLLPNASNSSDQLSTAYSTYAANLEEEVDIFSYGLIGFRPRQYMAALNLDDVSQVNLYQQFLGTKGTKRATNLFSLANLGKEIAEYNVYEYWAILRGMYGANANSSYYELLLNEALLQSDPSLIQVVETGQVSRADQTTLVNDIWKSSYKITSPDILPTTTVARVSDKSFPSAGYVNLNDVDITVFDLSDPTNITNVLDNVGIGTTVWVARVNTYNWNVYRTSKVTGAITQVSDNLDGQSIVTFDQAHNLSIGSILIIKNFDSTINGVYTVLDVPSIYSVTIDYTFSGFVTSIEGDGLGLTLLSTRVAQPSDIVSLSFANQLTPGVKVWVDSNAENLWSVLEKTEPFVTTNTLDAQIPVAGSHFGQSVAQGFWNTSALVGAPGYNPESLAVEPGAVYTYVRNDQDVYEQNSILELTATDAAGYGNQIDIGDQSWGIAGASNSNSAQGYATTIYIEPDSNVYEQRQLLVAPDGDYSAIEFGYSVTTSQNERWMFVSAPAGNKVYAYTRVDIAQQSVEYITTGTSQLFNWSNYISIDFNQPEQLSVVLDNTILNYPGDYSISSTTVSLIDLPTAGQRLIISRKSGVQLDQQRYYNVSPDAATGSGSDATFIVNRVRGDYTAVVQTGGADYEVGDTVTFYGPTIGGGTNPANNFTLTVSEVDSNGAIVNLDNPTGSGVSNTPTFQLDQYLATAINLWSFTVRVNDQLYRQDIDYTFDDITKELEFLDIPGAGAVILVDSLSYFDYVTTLEVPGPGDSSLANSRFGQSISCNTTGSQLMIGAPNLDQDEPGEAYIFDRNIQRIIVTDATQTEYYPVQDMIDPGFIAVTLNGEFLVNTELNVNGTFTVDTSNPSSQFVTITAPLAVGDVIEIETNQFTLLEQVVSEVPSNASKFGWKLDQCINDCSLYISSPYDSTIISEGGKVEVWRNQSRVYGTISSTIANPTLTPGEYIRINNEFVECTGTTIEDLFLDIAAANIPNVTATLTPNLVFEGDGTSKILDVGDIYSSVASYTPVVYVDDVLQTLNVDYTYNNTTQQISFVVAPFNTASIVVVSGRITINVTNYEAAQRLNKLTVLPGTGTVFDDIGFDVYVWQQTITPPVAQVKAHFGEGLFISDDTVTLMVGAPNGSMISPTTFDDGETYFDARSTNFFGSSNQSGVVYQYDALSASGATVENPVKFVFGQQFVNNTINSLDEFGRSIDYTTGILLIGAPGSDLGDSSANTGKVLQYQNLNQSPAWIPIHVQQPVVDIELLNTIYMYDRVSGKPRQYFDFFDPLQGRLLGAVQQNIDYIGAVDPAAYNTGTLNNYGSRWAQDRVGQIWWNTSNVRFIDPHQNDIVYASRRWGQIFPGSTIDVYQWVVSSVPPSEYIGEGTPKSLDNYVVTSSVNLQGFLETQYYFWVSGISTVDRVVGKTLSTTILSRYIESPKSSGISYVAPINASTVAIYNGAPYISAQDTILYIGYDREANDDNVHVEYQLVAQGRANAFLTDTLYKKMLDSLSGATTSGFAVPDPFLQISEKYGVEFRPRQSMVANRFLALKNYLGRANTVLALYPISEIRKFSLLNSSEPQPLSSSGAWDKRVANIEELSYQNLDEVDIGYKYLVDSDSTNNGFWAIYEVEFNNLTGKNYVRLIRVQNYDTKLYWSYVNWYLPGYNPLSRIITEVSNVSSLDTITVPEGSSVKVTSNAQGKWEIYLRENNSWTRVGLQDGTISFSTSLWNYSAGRFGFDSEVFDAQYFDQAPTTETRKILQAINEELFVDDLLLERNNLLMLLFNYIMSEQEAPAWLTKTSLIDVDHVIRDLVPYQIYRRDNQDFVLNYIQEVKPYHVQIREFNLKYQGLDTFYGNLTDFDLPAYWDSAQDLFISPVLDNTGTLSTTSSLPSTSPVWTTFPWNQWYQNYLLSLDGVTIIDGGSGYSTPPETTVTGDCVRQAVVTATINSAGQVNSIVVVDPGEGYSTTATITFTGGNGSGAVAVAVMGNAKIRNILTVIKYDRYQYTSDISIWEADTTYSSGSQVRYDDRVWEANAEVQTEQFDPSDWTLIPAGDLSGVDRTWGYYAPTPNQPGLDLALLMTGIDYPGVQVMAPTFAQNTGFDVGGFDVTPYDNISYAPDGSPTYDPAILDAIYSSDFTDPYLGILPAPAYDGDPPTTGPANAITVNGGAFVDTYESHAPEELVPGITYDTLDMRVFTTPGSDWEGNGHGFPIATRNFVMGAGTMNLDGALEYPVAIQVYNQTQGLELDISADFTVDWVNYTISVIQHAVSGDVISVNVYALGGGNQMYTNTYIGSVVEDTIVIPIETSLINSFAIFVNGVQNTDFTYEAIGVGNTVITFGTVFTSTDRITVTALGNTTTGVSNDWSIPVTQYFLSTGSLSYTLSNNLSGTNPANIIVNKNGVRARPSEGIEYTGDGSTVDYDLPSKGGYNLSLVADNDVSVYVNNVPLVLGVGFIVNPVDGSYRTVTLTTPPAINAQVLISVRTKAQYWVMGTTLAFQAGQGLIPISGDIISVTTWNNTSEQNLVTQVFVGPSTRGLLISEAYDSTPYDEGTIVNDPGTYDYSEGTLIESNSFDTGRTIIDTNRLIVTLDGYYLFPQVDWIADGSTVIILGQTINPIQVVAITSMTNRVVPGAIAFRIFQDMRGIQTAYRITTDSTTALAQVLAADDDIIYVDNASNLSEPNLAEGIFGLITINGERIAYRERDTVANTVSSLRRGTSGTAAASHAIDTPVYDIGKGNMLIAEYQNYVQYQNYLANGIITTYTTDSIVVSTADAVEVYVGGLLQTTGYTVTQLDTVEIEFDEAPTAGYQVSIRVMRGKSWYEPGSGTPSNGVPLQETDTEAARFIRGN